MIEILQKIVNEKRAQGLPASYIRNVLKEYLQVYVLFFIYTSKKYSKNLVFTGGTCLRHFYGLDRLSEDIDFDFFEIFDPETLRHDVDFFFVSKYKYQKISIALKQKGQQLLLKFPVLKQLGLASGNESDLLYVKVDLAPSPSKTHSIVITSKSQFGFNYAARHYDLPDLMAGKLHAILTRRYLKGSENRETIKGRDFYDLLWFIKKGVRPALQRLSEMLGRSMTLEALAIEVDDRVRVFVQKHTHDFKMDLTPLIQNTEFIPMYLDNYLKEYRRFKQQSFG